MNTYHTLNTHLLYNDVIEGDGRVSKEPTFLGSALIFIGLAVGFVALYILAIAALG